MADRLAANFDLAVDASLRELEPGDLGEQLVKYLADAHAIEAQSIQLLEKGPAIAGQSNLALVLRDHLEESKAQQRLIEARLDAHGATANKLQDAALRIGAVNWSAFFAAQPDTPAKLAGFAFAVEHLEIAAYELLQRVAIRAGDDETARIAERIIGEEHSAAARIRAQFENAMEAALETQGVA
jgi:ferritin-like metal-binding protein YciE